MTFSFFAREDNGTANNPALNLTGDPAVELTFVKGGTGGDIILETNGGQPDPDTQVEIGGTAYDFNFEFTGTMPTQKRDGSQQVPDQFEGDNVYVITIIDYPTAGETTRFAFLPDSDATQAEMDDFGNGAIDVQNVDNTPPPVAVCFARGTLIATPQGERPIEQLCAGDMVLTADGRAETVQWVSHTHFNYRQITETPALRPVCIPRGFLGRGMPHSDLWVSPQHRIVLRGWRTELHLGQEAVFIPAKHLMGEPGMPGNRWSDGVEYFHLLMKKHEIVLSNGLESESFFPGEMAKRGLNSQARRDLERVLDEQRNRRGSNEQAALATVDAREAQVIRPFWQSPSRAA